MIFLTFLRRDLLVFRRSGGDLFLLVGFFLLGVSLFAIIFGGDFDLLGRLFSGIFWILVLLSVILVQDRIFGLDYRSGFLFDIIVRDLLFSYLCSKVVSFYLVFCFPLILALPLVLVLFGFSFDIFILFELWSFIILGLGSLCLLILLGSSLVLGLRLGHLLLPLLIFPLGLPVLLFGYVGFEGLLGGEFILSVFLFLVGYLLLNLVLGLYFSFLLLRRA